MSTLGVPSNTSGRSRSPEDRDPDEDTEPLLGAPGDVTQKSWEGFQWNILTGTAAIAQGGIWVLAAIVWSAVFEHDWIFFNYHPLLNSAGLLFLVQAILVLQPTSTQKQKVRGAYIHSIFNLIAISLFVAAHVVIEVNKAPHPENRYQSVHSKIGVATYVLLYVQFLIGFTQFYLPSLYGGIDNAKAIYKYHRAFGYAILVVALVTVGFATQTTLNKNTLHIRLWAVVTTSVLVVTGVFPRIKKAKFGL